MAAPVSTQFGVAVHVLTLLAVAPTRTSSEQLATSAGANPVHVRRVLGALGHAGLVRSRPGPAGGWQLVPTAEAITLADVHGAVAGDRPVLGVHDAAAECPTGQRIERALRDLEDEVVAALSARLARTTIADLVGTADVDATWRDVA